MIGLGEGRSETVWKARRDPLGSGGISKRINKWSYERVLVTLLILGYNSVKCKKPKTDVPAYEVFQFLLLLVFQGKNLFLFCFLYSKHKDQAVLKTHTTAF